MAVPKGIRNTVMKTITAAVIGLTFALASFAQTPAPATSGNAAGADTTSTTPMKTKKAKKHKKAKSSDSTMTNANSTPATK